MRKLFFVSALVMAAAFMLPAQSAKAGGDFSISFGFGYPGYSDCRPYYGGYSYYRPYYRPYYYSRPYYDYYPRSYRSYPRYPYRYYDGYRARRYYHYGPYWDGCH